MIGAPDRFWRRLPHPVVWIGTLIGALDRRLNRAAWPGKLRRLLGILALVVVVAVAALAGAAIEAALRQLPGHVATIGLTASILIAQNSLYRHVAAVAAAFDTGGLAAARRAVSLIVGRDPDSLDEAGVCRAAIETAAENFSDGVVAPAFWFALLGLPGLAAYKAINTADSMIGHLSERHRDFGWAAARFDDLVNLAPARLAGVAIALATPLAGGSIREALRSMLRDARLHRSPNAGWPEAAMAGALGLALAGPRRYGQRLVDDPYLNPGGRLEAGPADIRRALRVFIGAAVAVGVAVLVCALALG
ncbi:MAG: adenosylcobinamide-phosphate synthase [Xanthobacteraceae bacterium]|nr:MAG: adenosylcobinamide-phosphate synthase [Xanthobacteraceae bacterium]